jgi:hypothetical protein
MPDSDLLEILKGALRAKGLSLHHERRVAIAAS